MSTETESKGADRLYRWYDENGKLLYVGISNEPGWRALAHLRGASWPKWATRMEVDPHSFPSRAAALEAEAEAIRMERPVFNVIHATASRMQQRRYLVARGVLPDAAPGVDDVELIEAEADLEAYRTAREDLPQIVRRAYDAGLSQADIARASGLSRQWVAELLARTAKPRH